MNLYFALIITGILLLILIWIHYRHTRGPERSAPDRGSASVPNQTLIANREGEELDSEELQRLGESINIHTSPENRGDSVGLEAQEEIALEPAPDEVMLQFNLELAEPHPVEQVCSLLAGRGLQPAPDGLYTKVLPDDPQQRSLYYLANGAREDGRLALEDDSEPVQYLVFFMQLPGPIAGRQALGDMLQVAEEICNTLGGILRDGQGEILSRARADAMLERASGFEAEDAPADASAAD